MFSQKKSILQNKYLYIVVAGLLLFGYWINQDSNNTTNEQDPGMISGIIDSPASENVDTEATGKLNQIGSDTKLILRVYDVQGNLAREQELLMPKEAISLSFPEVETYLASKYPGCTVGTISKEQIILHKTASPSQLAASGATDIEGSYYLIRAESGMIKIFLCDENGKEEFIKNTNIAFSLLSVSDQELFTYGIVKHSEEELDELLQDFES